MNKNLLVRILGVSAFSILIIASIYNLLDGEKDKSNNDKRKDIRTKAFEETKLLNPQQIASLKIADETDRIKENFELIKDQFELKLSMTIKTIVKVIEPIILIFFGAFILLLALGIILPVLNTTSMI